MKVSYHPIKFGSHTPSPSKNTTEKEKEKNISTNAKTANIPNVYVS